MTETEHQRMLQNCEILQDMCSNPTERDLKLLPMAQKTLLCFSALQEFRDTGDDASRLLALRLANQLEAELTDYNNNPNT